MNSHKDDAVRFSALSEVFKNQTEGSHENDDRDCCEKGQGMTLSSIFLRIVKGVDEPERLTQLSQEISEGRERPD